MTELNKKKLSVAHRLKLSESHKGYKLPEEQKRKISESLKALGLKRSATTRALMSKKQSGHYVSEETKKKISEAHKGKPKPYRRGVNNPNWKGGVTTEYKVIRKSLEYKHWRTAVFERDNYACVECGIKGIYLEADHIKRFSDYPELRFNLNNGRTLCRPCHIKTETYGNRKVVI